MNTQVVYASFDRFPSPKGAATHIDAFVRALGRHFPNVDLVTVPSSTSDDQIPQSSQPPHAWTAEGVTHHPIPADGEHLFDRVLTFRSLLWKWWQARFAARKTIVPIVHFRSIYEGYPIARSKSEYCHSIVYEVNGLPSIELKYHYPRVAEDVELLRKLTTQEDICLQAADLVLTVSQVNRQYLIRRGVNPERILVIQNGVDLNTFAYRPPTKISNRPLRILYVGTLTAWQGVSLAIEALTLYCRDAPATLTLLGPARRGDRSLLEEQAWKAGISDHLELRDAVSKAELLSAYHESDVVLAPLTRNDRNLVQGCCPLKVIEAMATGTPLIASNLPVVKELATNDVEAILVRPGSAKAIKNALFRIRNDATLSRSLAQSARKRVEREFSWTHAQDSLINAYRSLME